MIGDKVENNIRNYSVYCHKCITNGKRYIGITNNIEKRWEYEGCGYRTHRSSKTVFEKALDKYGWNGFEREVICGNLTRTEACDMEQELIKKYKTNVCKYIRHLDIT